MSKKIFKNIMAFSILIFAVSLILITGLLYNNYSIEHQESLKNEAYTIKDTFEIYGNDYLKSLDSPHRITIIKSDGTVTYDNKADITNLENHINRVEVQEALKEGIGYSERYSSTISKKTVYVAIKLVNGDILRISDTKPSVFSILLSAVWPIIFILITQDKPHQIIIL
jgi:two-component system phosphate regulon sensor histidine kinase PhoR